jgi:hypothetical protein
MASAPIDHLAGSPAVRRERPLYTSAALIACLVVLVGFAPSYYLKSVFGAGDLSTLKLVLGAVMSTWFALFLVQASLVAAGRPAIHRQLGVAGIFIAILVVVMGTTVGIASVKSGVSPIPGISPPVFLALPIGEMIAFAVVFGAAIAQRERADNHKRLMLLANLAMLAPAFARWPTAAIGLSGPLVDFALTDLVILACITYDTVKNRRLHPAFAAGFAFIIAVQFGRLALAHTAAWARVVEWLIA